MPYERESWTNDEVRALLEIRAEEAVMEQMENPSTRLYVEITGKLRERGIIKSKKQVINKLKYLQKRYQAALLHNNKSGNAKKNLPNEDIMYQIWGTRASTKPLNIVSSVAAASTTSSSTGLAASSTSTHTSSTVPMDESESEPDFAEELEESEMAGTSAQTIDQDEPITIDATPEEPDPDEDHKDKDDAAPGPDSSANVEPRIFDLSSVKKKRQKKSKLEQSFQTMSGVLQKSLQESNAGFQEAEDKRFKLQHEWEERMAKQHEEAQLKIMKTFTDVQLQTMNVFSQMMTTMMRHAAPPTIGSSHTAPVPLLATSGPCHSAPWPSHSAPGPSHSAPGPSHSAPGPSHSAPGRSHSTPGPAHSATGPSHSTSDRFHAASGPFNVMPGPSPTCMSEPYFPLVSSVSSPPQSEHLHSPFHSQGMMPFGEPTEDVSAEAEKQYKNL